MHPVWKTSALLWALAAGSAHASLVVNGGFETGDFTGWTVSGPGASVSAVDPHSGAYSGRFSGDSTSIEQMIATTPGASYDISFFFSSTGHNDNDFIFNWDGGAAEWVNADINPGFATLNFTLVASGALTPLAFGFRHDDGFWKLDDVRVTLQRGGELPLPGSLALAGVALLGLVAPSGRRRFANA